MASRMRDIAMGRVRAFLEDHQLKSKLFTETSTVNLTWWTSGETKSTFAQAVQAYEQGSFSSISLGHSFGPPWSTHWIRVDVVIPPEWREDTVRFRWNASAEECVFDVHGKAICGMNGSDGEDGRKIAVLPKGTQVMWICLACNGLFGNSEWGVGPKPPNPDKKCVLVQADIAVFDDLAWGLFNDLKILHDMAKELPAESTQGAIALRCANEVIDACDLADRATWATARKLAREVLDSTNGSSAHLIHALGMSHLDLCWLWTYSETRRKFVRTLSTQLQLMDEFEDFRFVVSNAQLFEWVMEDAPELWQRIKAGIARGKILPVGGTWVEMDCNIPSGESLVRQFLVGQRFFREHLGGASRILWIPDVFGYSSQMPQIMRQSGVDYFFTQKLSWNQVNRFPHNTFEWMGIDGSTVTTHFAPADTYCSHATVADVLKSEKQAVNKDRSNQSLLLFGHGDGGGGPTRLMLEQLTRMRNLDGLATVKLDSTPEAFFDAVAQDATIRPLPVWRGELYFEYHRGTYTSQAFAKLNNRRCEDLLHDVEFAMVCGAVASKSATSSQDRALLLELWKLLLLNQFHDALPGTSIHPAVRDMADIYRDIRSRGSALLDKQLLLAAGGQGSLATDGVLGDTMLLVNTLAHDRVVPLILDTALVPPDATAQALGNDKTLVLAPVVASSMTTTCAPATSEASGVFVIEMGESAGEDAVIMLSNGVLTATLCVSSGRLLSLVHGERECIEAAKGEGGNRFVIHDDVPLAWDAWDVDAFHLSKAKSVDKATMVVEAIGPLCATLKFTFALSAESTLVQRVHLYRADVVPSLVFECDVDWRETRKMLKVEFPLAIRSDACAYEVPFGVASRPTHSNTSWDWAKFEVCAQRFADLSEAGFGVALLNDSKYGHACRGNLLTLSLLRSPIMPDPTCDKGRHRFTFALMPHVGSLGDADVACAAANLNCPPLIRYLRNGACTAPSTPLMTLDRSGAIVSTIKPVEQSTSPEKEEIVVRIYESYGGRGVYTLTVDPRIVFTRVLEVNLLEDALDTSSVKVSGNKVTFALSPFEIKTLTFC